MRRRRDEADGFPKPLDPVPNVPDLYPDDHPAPEAPEGVDPDDTPILSDSPRRALSPDRFGKPRKEELRAQPANSDSVTDDMPTDYSDEEELRGADFPSTGDPGVTREIIDPDEP